jgi:alkylhydroperoxidase/carboxymuconolactone decarboxylase family protein YurZ
VKENNMPKGPLDVIDAHDHNLFEQIARARDLALTEGTLSLKHKLLIALALDAAHGAVNGVKSLAQQAMRQGATKEEIMETLRVVNHICGVGSIYTAAAALQDIL